LCQYQKEKTRSAPVLKQAHPEITYGTDTP
ncbi:unnamed protein product, partial [marine sediment metagenome]